MLSSVSFFSTFLCLFLTWRWPSGRLFKGPWKGESAGSNPLPASTTGCCGWGQEAGRPGPRKMGTRSHYRWGPDPCVHEGLREEFGPSFGSPDVLTLFFPKLSPSKSEIIRTWCSSTHRQNFLFFLFIISFFPLRLWYNFIIPPFCFLKSFSSQ